MLVKKSNRSSVIDLLKIERGWACVHLSIIEHAGDFDVLVGCAVRFD